MARREPVAIVGMGCRYPGSHGAEQLWETLVEGRDEVTDAPAYRARTRAGVAAAPAPPGAHRRGSLGAVDGFDWRAFQMSPRESKYVDPQQRLLLETTWEALEHAGLPFERLAGTHTAVFVGIMWPDYAKLLAENPAQLVGYATSGVGFALASNRISYAFDLRGPSISLDVQCASSLVAVSLAAGAIWSGEAEMALAGGVNLILSADSDLMMSRAGILSAAGSCRTFDADADGFVRGEGAGIVVLKPLERALADGDRVLAAIRGAACNHDGRRAPLTAPARESQVDLVRRACANAGVEPEQLDYVELHGTGTRKGDPIEAAALGEAIGGRPPDDPCLVGSIKTNIGHCESAAGVASLIKVALALHRGVIPPTINHRRRNPAIDSGAPVDLVTEARHWPARARPALAGVNGLSLGGGNAHVVLEQVPIDARPVAGPPRSASGRPLVLPVSARTLGSLRAMCLAYAEWLERVGDDATAPWAICAAAALRRTHHGHRVAVCAASAAKLARALRRRSADISARGAEMPRAREAPRVALFLPASFVGERRRALLRRLAELGPEPRPALVEVGDRVDHGVTGLKGLPERFADCPSEELAAALYGNGCDLRWSALYGARCEVVALPSYRWERERLWIDPDPPPMLRTHR
jgi:acyl transferase domain-containing protein